jgi:ketosteroid isomerase-like protein
MPSESTTPPLTRAEVEAFVRKYWSIFAAKQVRAHDSSFASDSFIFSSSSKRVEPGRLVLLRRQREYMSDSTKVTVQVSNIQIETVAPDVAVAAYNIQFDAERRIIKDAAGKTQGEKHLPNARVTHVVVRDQEGNLKILHEHISRPTD